MKIIIEILYWNFGVLMEKTDSSVMIRFIEEDLNKNKFYKSGCGITCDSDVLNEYQS